MAADPRMKRFYLNWEQQNDLLVVLQALIGEGVPGMTNSKGEVKESVGINHLIAQKKAELEAAGTWETFKSKAEAAGGMWEL